MKKYLTKISAARSDEDGFSVGEGVAVSEGETDFWSESGSFCSWLSDTESTD